MTHCELRAEYDGLTLHSAPQIRLQIILREECPQTQRAQSGTDLASESGTWDLCTKCYSVLATLYTTSISHQAAELFVCITQKVYLACSGLTYPYSTQPGHKHTSSTHMAPTFGKQVTTALPDSWATTKTVTRTRMLPCIKKILQPKVANSYILLVQILIN